MTDPTNDLPADATMDQIREAINRNGAAYVKYKDGMAAKTVDFIPGLILQDFNADGIMIGVEWLGIPTTQQCISTLYRLLRLFFEELDKSKKTIRIIETFRCMEELVLYRHGWGRKIRAKKKAARRRLKELKREFAALELTCRI